MFIFWPRSSSSGSDNVDPGQENVRDGIHYKVAGVPKVGSWGHTSAEGIIGDLIPEVDDILAIRDEIGEPIHTVFFVTRTWSGTEPGDGTFTETKSALYPTPRVVEYRHDLNMTDIGQVRRGDIMLKMISKQSYPNRDEVALNLDLGSNKESFYEIDGDLYRVIKVTEKHVVWNVLCRPVSDQGGRS